MIHFRKTHPLLKRTTFLTDQDVLWHGLIPLKSNWSESNRFVAYTLLEPLSPLYIAFNAGAAAVTFELPEPPPHRRWYRIVDTSLPSPNDFLDAPIALSERYSLSSYSSFVAKAL
jgi:pullulanase/glycogen debranching enzyme